MTTWQQEFWRAYLAWWLDGCPDPRLWWQLRMLNDAMARGVLLIGRRLLPVIARYGASLADMEPILRGIIEAQKVPRPLDGSA